MSDTITATGLQTRANRTQRAIAVDNFLRKALRVNDPRDPAQIAKALRDRYPEEADRERREREGLPYSTIRDPQERLPATAPLSSAEIETARTNLDRDIQSLITGAALKDISVELGGWGRSARKTAADGLAAARLAIDANSHDSALSARRTLNDYARLARYLGVVLDGDCDALRDFAQSCDVLASLILVGIGDGLAVGGVTRSTSLVRVAAGELQARRSAVISALRVLNGSHEFSIGQEDYPRGLVGYQALVQALEIGGQADLRALLEETALGQAMDELTDLTHGANVANLRELSTTSSILVHRFTRLVRYAETVARPVPNDSATESPPLLGFAAALQLFVDAFALVGAHRLLYLSRPPILAYGLYDNAADAVSQRLVALTAARGMLAEAVDCVACCGCSAEDLRTTALFDLVVSLTDRAIDLLAVGTNVNGVGGSERRAVATGVFALYAVDFAQNGTLGIAFTPPSQAIVNAVQQIALATVLPFSNNQQIAPPLLDADTVAQVVRELVIVHDAELQTETLVRRLGSACGDDALFDFFDGTMPAPRLRDVSMVRFALRSVVRVFDPNAAFDRPVIIDLPNTSQRSQHMRTNNSPDLGHVNI